MNKNQYIDRLVQQLSEYEIDDKYSLIANYEQIIDEILLDNNGQFNAVIEKLGSPEELADELASEFGFKVGSKPKAEQYVKRETVQPTYNKKRFKSNALWNVLLVLTGFFQACLVIGLVVTTVVGFQLGIRNDLIVSYSHDSYEDEIAYVTVVGCDRDNYCEGYRFTINEDYYRYSDYEMRHMRNHYYTNWVERCDGDYLCGYNGKDMVVYQSYSFPIALIIGLSYFIIISILLIVSLLIINPIRRITRENSEYNRRRYYE